jgi:branched-chain amino acid transport system substrate-binding protein
LRHMSEWNHRRGRRYWLLVAALVIAVAGTAAACGGDDDEGEEAATTGQTQTAAAPSGNAIKVGILSDCEGAFGPNYEQDIGGAIAAFSEYAGAKPVNPSKPSAGMTGGSIGGKPIRIVGYGCGNDRADRAIKETKRLMEQLDADILIGPLSGDESIAVANYAKAHPTKTFVNGTAGAQDTTLKVQAPNFFRFNGDGAMWNAGIGKIAYETLKWRKAAIIMDDYSFAWTSGAGMIVDFCARGGQITDRVFPPLNTTDYSSFARQLPGPDEVDGYFWAVGGSGTIPSIKAFESAHGKIKANQIIGNLFFFAAGADKQLGPRLNGAYVGGFGTSPDLNTQAAKDYKAVIGKWFDKFPPLAGPAENYAPDGFTFNYFINTQALIEALKTVNGDISGGQKKLQEELAKVELDTAYGPIKLDENRQGIQDQWSYQLVVKNGVPGPKTVQLIPQVEQTFGGVFSADGPAPSRTFPKCEKADLPWIGKEKKVVNGVPQD